MTRLLLRSAGLLLAVAGCSVTTIPIHGSDGRPYLYLDCDAPFQSLDDCYAEANRVCPGGYRIANDVAPRTSPFGNLVLECANPQLPAASGGAAR